MRQRQVANGCEAACERKQSGESAAAGPFDLSEMAKRESGVTVPGFETAKLCHATLLHAVTSPKTFAVRACVMCALNIVTKEHHSPF